MEPRGPQLAVVTAVQGSKARLSIGVDAKDQLLPQRQLDRLSALPPGVEPPRRLGALPWRLTAEALEAARPQPRALGEAWLLLLESSTPLPLGEFTELVCGGAEPCDLGACWLHLVGPQLLFRWRQGEVQARPLADLRALRRERRRQSLLEQQERRWLQRLQARQPLAAESLLAFEQQRLEQLHCRLRLTEKRTSAPFAI